ncbi:hypothetical protein ACHAXR_012160 [Thalassiosira sp. AJA248-18]
MDGSRIREAEEQLSKLKWLGLDFTSDVATSSSEVASAPRALSLETPRPQLIYQSNTTAIYRLYDVGYKVILDENNSHRLVQEQNISNFLPPSVHKRHVTDVTRFINRPALSFKWAHGSTVQEWLQQQKAFPHLIGKYETYLNSSLKIAIAITKTLSEFHDGGVFYNSLSMENIVVSQQKEGQYVATFIDLSRSAVFRKGDHYGDQLKTLDFKGLGLVLNQLFQGDEDKKCSPTLSSTLSMTTSDNEGNEFSSEVGGSNDRRVKRVKQRSLGEGLPLYLSSLISALVSSSTTAGASQEVFGYESARDVLHDLKYAESTDILMKKTNVDECAAAANNRLRLPQDMFHGRIVQMSMLQQLLTSTAEMGTRPLMGTISGYPGSGKSALVQQLKKPLKHLNGSFIEGKFDKDAHTDSILSSALNIFFGEILANSTENTHTSMKWRIQDALGSGANDTFFGMIPNLKQWLSGVMPADENGHSQRSACLRAVGPMIKFMFCKLIGAIACKAHPVLLFLDDLQWSDEMTLDIVRMIMADPDVHHFLFLGSYRDSEVGQSHPLTGTLSAIKKQGTQVISIKVGPVEKETVDALLSEALCIPPSLCKPLSIVVHRKTSGVILFILRFLLSLNDDGDLWFSKSSGRWVFNLSKIELKEVHNDVVSYMTEKMKLLPKKLKMGLQVAACLGNNFSPKALEKAQQDGELVDTFLEECVGMGFIRKASFNHYVWVHDLIQQSAFDLIPSSKLDAFRLLLGSRIFLNTAQDEMKSMIFYICDNMNRGLLLIEDKDQKYELAELNLRAGKKAIAASAFQSATKLLSTGVSLLGHDCWTAHYELAMKLYNEASDVLYATGEFGKLSELMEAPLVNARKNDKWNIQNNLVRSLSASCKFEAGIASSLSILKELGEDIPSEPASAYIQEVVQIRKVLAGKTDQEMISLPIMSDPQLLARMQFMNSAITMSAIAKPILFPILTFRMIKCSIEHGICNISALAFSAYGAFLAGEPHNDVEEAYRFGRIGLAMLKRLGATDMLPRVYMVIYGTINTWKEAWHLGLDKHIEAYEVGTAIGDMDFAIGNVSNFANKAVFGCGVNLENLSVTIHAYARRAFQCNQSAYWMSLVMFEQICFDLMGIKQNAFSLYAADMTEDTCLEDSRQKNMELLIKLIFNKRKFVGYYTGDMDTVGEMHELGLTCDHKSSNVRLPGGMIGSFIDGLAGFYFARKFNSGDKDLEAKWRKVGDDEVTRFSKWTKHSRWNFANKLYLLEAEQYFYEGNNTEALRCYHASIQAAKEHKFVQEEGLAEEKLATYLTRMNMPESAIVHFINAKKCYLVWGARALVTRMERTIEMIAWKGH